MMRENWPRGCTQGGSASPELRSAFHLSDNLFVGLSVVMGAKFARLGNPEP
jgi:hypothetical protein